MPVQPSVESTGVEQQLILGMLYHPNRTGQRWNNNFLRQQGYVCAVPAVWDAPFLWLEPKDYQTLKHAGTHRAEGLVKCKKCGYTADVRDFKPSTRTHSDVECPNCGSTQNDH